MKASNQETMPLLRLPAAQSSAEAKWNARCKQVAAFEMKNAATDRLSSSSVANESGKSSKTCSKVRELKSTLSGESREA